MGKNTHIIAALFFSVMLISSASSAMSDSRRRPFTYTENFDEGELNAWASYPPNQDTAYDPYIYPGNITPGDDNICLVSYCDPPWNETQRLGAVKRLGCYLDHTSNISFRYYIKTVITAPELTIHVPMETGERIVYTYPEPAVNSWQTATIGWDELAESYPDLENRDYAGMTALIVQIKVPDADPDMPVYFGLDDITVQGLRSPSFIFTLPETVTLPEFRDHVAVKHYRVGDTLKISGVFESEPESAEMFITTYGDREKRLMSSTLKSGDNSRFTNETILEKTSFPAGLYRAVIRAVYDDSSTVETSCAFLVTNDRQDTSHPRLIYDSQELPSVKSRFTSPHFDSVRHAIETEAARLREELDPATLVYDTDQFPEKDWLSTLSAWSGNRIRISREALFYNSLAYSLLDDREAGDYCREVMLMLASWPQWNHPWMEKRGLHTYYPLGEFALDYSIAYDLCCGLLGNRDREIIRNALYDNYIEPAYRTYVIDDQVTSNTSNWISHIIGGALFALAAIDSELPDDRPVEPGLIGSLMKMHSYITTSFGRDGSYGEGFRYFNFAMQSFAWTLPAIEKNYGVDFSGPLQTAHMETLWASNLDKNYAFTFGDSEPFLKREATAKWIAAQNGPMNSWAWLISRSEDPVLTWLYHELKEFDTIHEVLYDVSGVAAKKPDPAGTVKFFRDVGTAVFKSGWNADDFSFVFRCGPFYNHQHLDQGTFYLADHGEIFIEERHDGEHHYYDDPVYRSHAIQPIAHNTILIDGNPQSQKTGDPKGFAQGMNDQARFTQWLDSPHFAFVSGDLTGVYPDGPETLSRSALYIKPRTILMLTEAESERDMNVGLLFHTKWKKDIAPGDDVIRFSKDGPVLFLYPITPEDCSRSVHSEPHFLAQFAERPLKERGYLTLSANTGSKGRLVMAELMTATADGSDPGINIHKDRGVYRVECPSGENSTVLGLSGIEGANRLGDWRSDAAVLAVHGSETGIFSVNATWLEQNGDILMQSDRPVTFFLSRESNVSRFKYFAGEATAVRIAVDSEPEKVEGAHAGTGPSYDAETGRLELLLNPGEGAISIIQ